MTVGSWVSDNRFLYGGLYPGTYSVKGWIGEDRPRVSLPPSAYRDVFRHFPDGKGGFINKRYRIRVTERPPKRVKDRDHPYSMNHMVLSDSYAVYPNGAEGLIFGFANAGNWRSRDLFDANDQLALVGKLKESMQGSDFNLAVFLGEGHQTLELIADTASRLHKAYQAVRKGQLLKAANVLVPGTTMRRGFPPVSPLRGKQLKNSLADYWLELQYGWLPLLGDAESAAQSLAHALNSPLQTSYRVSKTKKYKSTNVQDYGPGFMQTTENIQSLQRSLIARISEHPSALAQLGLLNPEIVAWELVPFSFVADWFIPIGSYLEARGAASHMVGTFVTSDKRIGLVNLLSTNATVVTGSPPDYFYVSLDRTISTTLAVPLPTFKPLSKALSWKHCANSVALLVGFSKTVPSVQPSGKPPRKPYNWGHGFQP